jgi:hypothetical protein
MMRAAIAGLVASAVPLAVFASPGLPDVGSGSIVYWSSSYEGASDQFHERVLAVGDDWVLFKSKFDDEFLDDEISDLFMIFSGIEYRACDESMPSDEDREALASLFPLEEGRTISLALDDDELAIRVGSATSYFLMGQMHPAHDVFLVFEDEEYNQKTVVLDEKPFTVAIDWDEKSSDRVMSITSPKEAPRSGQTTEDLGNCAAFLTAR